MVGEKVTLEAFCHTALRCTVPNLDQEQSTRVPFLSTLMHQILCLIKHPTHIHRHPMAGSSFHSPHTQIRIHTNTLKQMHVEIYKEYIHVFSMRVSGEYSKLVFNVGVNTEDQGELGKKWIIV